MEIAIDPDEEIRWISRLTGIDDEVVRTALVVEMEYLATIGLAEWPPDYTFRFYPPPDGEAAPFTFADMALAAADCHRFTGIDESVANEIYAAEVLYYETMGLL